MDRADAERPNMGLTAWKDAPIGKIQKTDVVVAKNYLTEFEFTQMGRMASGAIGDLICTFLRSCRKSLLLIEFQEDEKI